MMQFLLICFPLFAFIILIPFFDSVNNLDSILFYKRTFNQDGITDIVSDEQQNPNNAAQHPPNQIKKRKRGVKKPLTQEQKEIHKEKAREYKLSQSRKGLKEAKKYMTPEAYAKLEKSANRRRHMEKINQRRYRERKEERKSSITPLKLDFTLQSESQKLDIERANRAAFLQLSSSPPFKKNIHKHKDTQAQHPNRMQEGPSQP